MSVVKIWDIVVFCIIFGKLVKRGGTVKSRPYNSDVQNLESFSYKVPPQYPITSVDNALKLILLLGEHSEIRLTEASAYLGVASSTAHRLLAMLQYRGFVRQDPRTKAYQSGASLTNVAFSVLGRLDVRTQARPFLEKLNLELQETVHLGMLEGSMIRFIDAIESPRAVRVASRMGKSMLAHCTSTGRAIMAELPVEEIKRLYPDEQLVQMTTQSISKRSELLDELEKVRQNGYATNKEESEEGVSSVSVAVKSMAIASRFAVNVAAPSGRMTPGRIKEVGGILKSITEEIAESLT